MCKRQTRRKVFDLIWMLFELFEPAEQVDRAQKRDSSVVLGIRRTDGVPPSTPGRREAKNTGDSAGNTHANAPTVPMVHDLATREHTAAI